MNNSIGALFAILCCAVAAFFVCWGLAVLVRRYVGASAGKAALILALSLVVGTITGVIRASERDVATPLARWQRSSDVEPLPSLCAGLLAVFVVIFLAKLHSKWIAGAATDAEKKPGMEGVRVWLAADNIICVALISLLAWLAFDYSPSAIATLGLLALLAYPGMFSASVYLHTPAGPEANAPERQRVLNLLDTGKITASECAELLSALNYSEKPRAAKAAVPQQRLALVGAVLLLIGFFLPWFSFNPQSEMNRVAQGLPIDPNWTQRFLSNAITMDPVRISGGDIQHGLGWLVLFLGMAAAALPYLAVNLTEQTRQRAVLAGLAVGAIILLYLVTQNLRFVSVGIFLAVVGYGLQLAGALRGGHLNSQEAV